MINPLKNSISKITFGRVFDKHLLAVRKMSTIKEALMYEVGEPVMTAVNKVTIVGVGQVGMACAFSLLTQVNSFKF